MPTEVSETSHICKETHTTSHKSVLNIAKSGLASKLSKSKLKQKPLFKSQRKANPRLSQQSNNIKNYFSKVGTIHRAKGRGEGESALLSLYIPHMLLTIYPACCSGML